MSNKGRQNTDWRELNNMTLNKTYDSVLSIYLLYHELINHYNRVKWFTYHLSRCKKRCDIIKLTVIIVTNVCLCAILISKIVDATKEVIDCLLPPLTKKPQLLLNERN